METNRPVETTVNSAEDVPDPEEEEKRAAAAARAANHLPELRLVMLGWRWPGKSLTGNTILGREDFHLERAAEFSVKRQTDVQGRQVIVVDTPGWFSNQDTPPSYQQEMVKAASMCPPGPHAFLLVIPVGMFTEVDRARIEEHVSLFGERVWRHTLVVFTWAEVLRSISIERYIRREGRDLQWVLEKCKKRYFVINNCVFGEHPQLGRLMEKVEKMVAEEGGFYNPEEVEEKKKPLDENQNPTENKAREGRELGARPKQNSSLALAKPMEVDPPLN
ncbi:GTPase IMAP family member 4 isoform X2 [Myripristis murdjan]|uniref:GTPase IMAP family member 4 isoform X2 n=1 Tax=Myripristis murdjan TaxID=586833 RepID=UPI001175EFCC|nr:GTPase IMAP family member 9-like isoform X2 [Myripristis murdjan]